MGFFIVLLIALSSLWTFWDAAKNKIAQAGMWGAGCFLLWIVVFPLYLIRRSAMLKKAETDPVETSAFALKMGIFAVVAIGFISIGLGK